MAPAGAQQSYAEHITSNVLVCWCAVQLRVFFWCSYFGKCSRAAHLQNNAKHISIISRRCIRKRLFGKKCFHVQRWFHDLPKHPPSFPIRTPLLEAARQPRSSWQQALHEKKQRNPGRFVRPWEAFKDQIFITSVLFLSSSQNPSIQTLSWGVLPWHPFPPSQRLTSVTPRGVVSPAPLTTSKQQEPS